MIVFLLLNLAVSSAAFQCYTCNDEPHDDDTKPCHDMVNTPQLESRLPFWNQFLLPAGLPYVWRHPYEKVLHSQEYPTLSVPPTTSGLFNVPECEHRSRWRRSAGPPASPAQTTSLLCVCTTPLCNEGTHKQVIENTMMNNLPTQRLQEVLREPLPPPSEPSEDIQMQMADAGF